MSAREAWATLVVVLLVSAACSAPTATPSPAPTDTPDLVFSEPLTTQFLVDHVGEEYFWAHYVLAQAEYVAPDLIKAAYLYTFEPYVEDQRFTLLFDTSTLSLSDEEVSVVLLEAQTFDIDRDEAITIALQNGLEPTHTAYDVSVSFGPTTQNRFAWEVASPDLSPGSEASEPIIRVILDVEDGQIYAVEKLKPMQSH